MAKPTTFNEMWKALASSREIGFGATDIILTAPFVRELMTRIEALEAQVKS